MAIQIMNPNIISAQVEEMYNINATKGKKVVDDFSKTITLLNSHWKGSDAVNNIKDLTTVCEALLTLVKELDRLIVDVNSEEIVPFQDEICKSGGQCTVGEKFGYALASFEPTIPVPADATESYVDPEIVSDANEFNSFPEKFEEFVSLLNESKEKLFNNWLESGSRGDILGIFDKFNESVADYKSSIVRVRDNLNTVAENKKNFL